MSVEGMNAFGFIPAEIVEMGACHEGRVTFCVPTLNEQADGDYPEGDEDRHMAPVGDSNVYSSLAVDQGHDGGPDDEEWRGPWHLPAVDIDLPCKLVESSTPGHFHLLIDKPVRWQSYMDLLWALVEAGIVQEGYAKASEARGATYLRLPWVKKTAAVTA
jgi:hypothetical protein